MMTQYSSQGPLDASAQQSSLAAFLDQQNLQSCLLVTVDSASGEWQEVQALTLAQLLACQAQMQQNTSWQQLGPHHLRRSDSQTDVIDDPMLALEDLMSVHKTLLQDMLKAANDIDGLFQTLAAPCSRKRLLNT